MENTENKDQTIADAALTLSAEQPEENTQPENKPAEEKKPEVRQAEKPEVKTVDKPAGKKYLPGNYRADKYMRIIKELTYTHTKDENGKVQKTHGTWAKPKNMIIFKKGVETPLTEEDVSLPAIQRLIDSKVIYRMG